MEQKEKRPSLKQLRYQIFAVICAALNHTPVGIGYSFSSILLPPSILKGQDEVYSNNASYEDANATISVGSQKTSHYLEVSSLEASWIASLLPLFSVFGAILTGRLMDRFGRKSALILTSLINLVGWCLTIASAYCVQLVYVARILNGFGEGLCMVSFVYVAEISHPSVRASFLAIVAGSLSLGIALTSTLGYFWNWFNVAIFTAVFILITFVCTLFPPETPQWILKNVRDVAERDKRLSESLSWMYRDRQLYELQLSHFQNLDICSAAKKVEESSNLWKPVTLSLVMMTFEVITGGFITIFFSHQIFEAIGSESEESSMFLMLLGFSRLLAATLAATQIFGRRPLFLSSAIGMALCMFLAAYLITIKSSSFYIGILILLYIAFATYGVLGLTDTLIGELLPHNFRGKYSGLFYAYAFFLAFLSIQCFIYIENAVGIVYIFVFFGACSAMGAIFIFVFIIETKGKLLEDIQEEMKVRNTYCCSD